MLAEDIAQRLNGLVIYGYINDWSNGDEWGDFNFVEQGRVGKADAKIYGLKDMNYWDRIKKPEEYKDNVAFELYDEHDYDSYSCYILKDSFILHSYFVSRWWSFCRTFTGENSSESWLRYVQDYRMQCKNEIERFGGDMAFYLDDQGGLKPDEWDFERITFREGLQTLRSTNNAIDVSAWISNGKIPVSEYPVAFIDDFSVDF